jgi:hypothetical protein
MLQRIQSFYLFIVVVLLLMIFFNPLAIFFDQSGNLYMLLYIGVEKLTSSGWIIIKHSVLTSFLLVISIILTLVSIVLYKNRKIQIKVCYILMILLFCATCTIFLTYKWVQMQFLLKNSNLSMSSILPVISIILVYLAIIAIKKDEKLVRSADRIR